MFESNKVVARRSAGTEALVVVGLVVPLSAAAACMDMLGRLPAERLVVLLIDDGSEDISALPSGVPAGLEAQKGSDGLLLTSSSIVWIPAGESFCVSDGYLRRSPGDEVGPAKPSDLLFQSLGREFGPRAICIRDHRDLAGALLDLAFSDRRLPLHGRPAALLPHGQTLKDTALGLVDARSQSPAGPTYGPPPSIARQWSLGERCRHLLMDQYAPAAIVINAENQCLFSLGRIQRYFALPPIHPASDVLEMAHPYLRGQLQAALERARANNGRATIPGTRLREVGEAASFQIDIQTIHDGTDELLLICFVESRQPEKPEATGSNETPSLRETIQSLEALIKDQDQVEHMLRADILRHQSAGEELRRALSELQLQEQALRASHTQLQQRADRHDLLISNLHDTLSSMRIAVLHLDRDLRISCYSPAESPLLNVRPSDVGRPLAELRLFAADTHLISDAEEVLHTLSAREREMQSDDGTWYERRITPYFGTQNEVAGVRIVFMDITQRRLALDALDAANQRAAIQNVARARFLAGVNHDLRQPLQTIALLQGLLATFTNDEKATKLVTQLDQTLQVVTNMIDTLLHIDQLDNGVVTVETRSFCINNILKRVRDEFASRVAALGIDLRIVPSSISVKSDPLVVELLLRNLLENIIRNAKPSCILVGCRRARDGLSLEIWAPSVELPVPLATLFDGRTRSTVQTDLSGWLLVKRLADLLGHDVRYPAPISRRPHFRIGLLLPYAQDKHDYGRRISITRQLALQPPPFENGAPGSNDLLTGRRELMVFIVEDDADVRSSLKATLENHGAKVETYESAESFLESRQARSDACLLLDAHLPGMSGIELLTLLGNENRPRTLMITGRSDVVLAVQAMKAGAIDFLEKPIGAGELIARIARAASERELNHAPASPNGADSRLSTLTPRQRQIMDLILEGHPSKIIASKLGISQRTVEGHRATIMNKTGSKSVAALARFALSSNRTLS
jgi:two-component system, chemotaxis family, CheB/CheR fusion protein